MGKIKKTQKKWALKFYVKLTSKTNLRRDIAITICVIFISAGIIIRNNFSLSKSAQEQGQKGESATVQLANISSEQIAEEVKSIQEKTDNSNWEILQSQWYGFRIKYPGDWAAPVSQAARKDSNWEYRYQFRKKNIDESNSYIGFDVVIYNLSDIKEVSATDEFPARKTETGGANFQCGSIEGHVIDTGDYPAEEIYIPSSDDCYNPALFFNFTKGDYVYNLVPRLKEGASLIGDPQVEAMDNFPELFSVVSAFEIIDITRPSSVISKPTSSKPRVASPMPLSYSKESGRLVCSKKNDHPSKSVKNKGRHLDMECCLDPDEYPNSNCYYPSDKYGKYLK